MPSIAIFAVAALVGSAVAAPACVRSTRSPVNTPPSYTNSPISTLSAIATATSSAPTYGGAQPSSQQSPVVSSTAPSYGGPTSSASPIVTVTYGGSPSSSVSRTDVVYTSASSSKSAGQTSTAPSYTSDTPVSSSASASIASTATATSVVYSSASASTTAPSSTAAEQTTSTAEVSTTAIYTGSATSTAADKTTATSTRVTYSETSTSVDQSTAVSSTASVTSSASASETAITYSETLSSTAASTTTVADSTSSAAGTTAAETTTTGPVNPTSSSSAPASTSTAADDSSSTSTTVIYTTSSTAAPATSTTTSTTTAAVVPSSTSTKYVPESTSTSTAAPTTSTAAPVTTTTQPATPTHSNKLIGYWGQNAASHSGGSQGTLASYCAKGIYDTINLSFLSVFKVVKKKPIYSLNFANLGGFDSATDSTAASGWGMDAIAQDIKTCQSLGVKVLLSVGGGTNGYDVQKGDGLVLAKQWHNAFFGGSDASETRPFPGVTLDGFDLDIERKVDQQELVVLAKYLRAKNPGLIVTSAPQCFLGDNNSGEDANLGGFLKSTSAYDYIQVQFYNNPSCEIGAVGFEANFKKWVSLYGKNVVILLPGSSASAGDGFVQNTADVAAAAKKLRAAYKADTFDAIGLFDVSSAEAASGGVTVTAANLAYDYGIRAALDSF
ncbi:hypothetical protein HK101_003811 [Irineochytrium annulatum]|nr:hypothetical protein HK101_003811 [Irineochytrium annulatum]